MRGRRVFDALARGALAVAANPTLVLAPIALWVATLLTIALSLLLLLVPLGTAFLGELGSWRGFRMPDFERLGSELFARILASPLLLVMALLGFLVLMTLLLVLASFLRAGTTAVLLEAEKRALEGAPRSAFGVETGAIFFREGRRHTGRFFGLLNLYAIAVTLLVALVIVPLVAAVACGIRGVTVVPALLVFALSIPVFLAGVLATEIATFAAAREIVSRDEPMLDGVAHGLSLLRATVGRSAGLFFVLAGLSLAVAAVFTLPRMAVLLVSGSGSRLGLPLLFLNVVLIAAQTVAVDFVQLVAAGAFVSLWTDPPPAPARETAPPVAFTGTFLRKEPG